MHESVTSCAYDMQKFDVNVKSITFHILSFTSHPLGLLVPKHDFFCCHCQDPYYMFFFSPNFFPWQQVIWQFLFGLLGHAKELWRKIFYLCLVMICEGVQTRYNELTSVILDKDCMYFYSKIIFLYKLIFKQNLLQIVIKIILVPICTWHVFLFIIFE